MYIYLVPLSAEENLTHQLTSGEAKEKSLDVADINIWSDPSLIDSKETFPWMQAMTVHWATCMFLMENRSMYSSVFYKGFPVWQRLYFHTNSLFWMAQTTLIETMKSRWTLL